MNKSLPSLFFLLLFLALIPQNLHSQIRLGGKVIDSETKEPIVLGELIVLNSENELIKIEKGNFVLFLNPGVHKFRLTSKGYLELNFQLKLKNDSLINLTMSPSYRQMEEVLIEDNGLKSELQSSSLNIEQFALEENSKTQQNSLAEVLAKKPGIQAFNTGVGVSKPIIRGFMANRVAVINYGIRQEGQQWGKDHGLEIDPFSVERVQIIKGAASLQYGSSASGGVLRIMEDLLPKKGLGFQYNSKYKSNNQSFGQSLKLSFRKNKHYLIGRYSAEDYQDFKVADSSFTYNGFTLPLVNGILKNTAGNSRSLGLGYGYNSDKIQLRLNFSNYHQNIGLFPGATGIPRAFDLETLGDPDDIDLPNQEVKHQSFKFIFNYKIKDNWLENNVGWQINERQENSNPLAHGFLQLNSDDILAIGLDLNTISHNSRYQWKSEGWKTIIGLDQQFQKNERSGWEFLLPNFESYEAGVFGIVDKKENEFFNWNVGLRLQYVQIESEEHLQAYFANIDSMVTRANPLSKSFSNYSFSMGFTYRPNSSWSHKLNFAKSFRTPVAAELLSNGVHHGTFRHEMGDADLEIENGLQIDWASEWETPNYRIKASPFFNYFSNFIYLNPSGKFSPLPDAGQIYTYSATEAIHTGAELYLEGNFRKHLTASLGMEYVYNLNLKTGLALPFSPPYSQVADISFMLLNSTSLNWKINVEQRLTAAQNRVDRNENTTPAFGLYAMNTELKIYYKSLQINLGFGIRNIFNQAYLNHLSRYRILNLSEQGRNLIFQANITF